MDTEFVQIKDVEADRDWLVRAGELIRLGELVAFPTETVYGLGGNALAPEASRRIYAAKGRPSDNPLIVHIAGLSELMPLVKEAPESVIRLAEAFWPGPLTMILPKSESVPFETTGGLDTVAVRMPNHPVARELILESRCPIAAPSANVSGRPSPTCAAHVKEDLDGRIAMILDGGAVDIGLESTIIDLTGKPMVLRPGYITTEMLSAVLGEAVLVDPALLSADDNKRPKAPGMKYRHYAPRAQLLIIEGEDQKVVEYINRLSAEQRLQGRKVAVIAAEETIPYYQADAALCIGRRTDEDAIAQHLYELLRQCDALEIDRIYSESFATPRIGGAIMNRLLKAAGHQVINVEKDGNL